MATGTADIVAKFQAAGRKKRKKRPKGICHPAVLTSFIEFSQKSLPTISSCTSLACPICQGSWKMWLCLSLFCFVDFLSRYLMSRVMWSLLRKLRKWHFLPLGGRARGREGKPVNADCLLCIRHCLQGVCVLVGEADKELGNCHIVWRVQ